MKVYIETSVWSFALADDSPELTAHTLRFFDECRDGRFETMIGPVVVQELLRSDSPVREALLALVQEIAPETLPAMEDADELAEVFLNLGAVPPSKPDDAAHVAYAFAAGADVLVSWNFKHIANVRRSQRFNGIAALQGYTKPLIITSPSEVAYGDA